MRHILRSAKGKAVMRTVLNILNFVLGGFFTTLSWLFATLISIVLIFTLPLTRSCWEITKLSFLPFGNEAVHVDVLRPDSKSHIMNTGGTFLNIFWLIFFGWWLCLSHISVGIVQCVSIIGIPVGIANFKIAAIALWPVGRRVVSVEEARAARDANARRRY
ncbi:Inner membrane protein YccF [Pantoea ananatis]|nr:Inner membrane protein YccF [Pantoea ananatis]CRH33293.1 Inner membrane protein YccF [Pantoea ananatis]CRH37806.1 Inner membrane protein YccF [Pantoea ananatis]